MQLSSLLVLEYESLEGEDCLHHIKSLTTPHLVLGRHSVEVSINTEKKF